MINNSAVRVGVVNATGGNTRWLRIPAIPETTTSPAWTGEETQVKVILQHLNRLQNVLQVMAGDNSKQDKFAQYSTDKG